jgi:sodium/bile acid cotransporter 7
MRRLSIDPYLLAMAATVGTACLVPVHGIGAVVAGWAVKLAIAFLFFLYGARLSPSAALDGLRHWQLHSVVLACTFVLFPLLGLAARVLVPNVISPQLYAGLLFLCVLPSTVQSSIAFTSIARGNVAAALCAASASNLIGIFATPLLVAALMNTQAGFSFNVLLDIVMQLLAPFLAGQVLRPWIAGFVQRHKPVLGYLDRGSILLVIYAAFSEGIVSGAWHGVAVREMLLLAVASSALLAVVMLVARGVSRLLGFSREDEIAIIFCGSKKSLASGLPMASVLFSGGQVGLVVIPLMLFHQIQLMVCAVLAQRYAKHPQVVPAE